MRYSRFYSLTGGFGPIYDDALISIKKKRIYPVQNVLVNTVSMKFALQKLVRHSVKGFLEVENEDIRLLALIDRSCPVVDDIHELGLTTMIFAKGMLAFVEDVVLL